MKEILCQAPRLGLRNGAETYRKACWSTPAASTGSATGPTVGSPMGIKRELESRSMVTDKSAHYCPQVETCGHGVRTKECDSVRK
jgi:hypothetical protein